jgi:hypothetical protein
MIVQEMVLMIPYNKHHQNQDHKKHTSMLQKTGAAADRSKRDVIGDKIKEGKVQEIGTSWTPQASVPAGRHKLVSQTLVSISQWQCL